MTFLSLKNDVNVQSKRNKNKNSEKKNYLLLASWKVTERAGSGSASGSVPKCYGTRTLVIRKICKQWKRLLNWRPSPLDNIRIRIRNTGYKKDKLAMKKTIYLLIEDPGYWELAGLPVPPRLMLGRERLVHLVPDRRLKYAKWWWRMVWI